MSKILYAIVASIWTPLMLTAFCLGFLAGMAVAR